MHNQTVGPMHLPTLSLRTRHPKTARRLLRLADGNKVAEMQMGTIPRAWAGGPKGLGG
jgi:hypothetical protein